MNINIITIMFVVLQYISNPINGFYSIILCKSIRLKEKRNLPSIAVARMVQWCLDLA